MNKKFATVINCMDGRAQLPVIEYIKETYEIDFVDMITEPGPNKILSDNDDAATVDSIKKRVEISVLKHSSQIIAVVGHFDCAGNPASEQEQKEHLVKSVNVIKEWGLPVKIISGLWLNESFEVSKVI